jgi:hypothetical protein
MTHRPCTGLLAGTISLVLSATLAAAACAPGPAAGLAAACGDRDGTPPAAAAALPVPGGAGDAGAAGWDGSIVAGLPGSFPHDPRSASDGAPHQGAGAAAPALR